MILYNHHLMLFPPTYIYVIFRRYHSVQFSSVAQSCPTLCGPMNCSMPGLRVHYQLLEFTQTNVHRVGDAIQPSCPLSSPSPPASNPSQNQGLWECKLVYIACVCVCARACVLVTQSYPTLCDPMDYGL